MSIGYYLRIGDKTTCGGRILTGDPAWKMDGIAVARRGDKVSCGKNKQTYTLIGGIRDMSSQGIPLAGTLDSKSGCPCQARLIASLRHATYSRSQNTAKPATSATDQNEPVQFAQAAGKALAASLPIAGAGSAPTQASKEGKLRLLTQGEIALAKSIYGEEIEYHKVWVHCDSYLPFGMQGERVAMTPNGELYFREATYSPDFSKEKYEWQHLFIHEMAHVWQYQKGMWVKARGIFSWAVDYQYQLDGRTLLREYGMEQQASIIADYFLLTIHGPYYWHKELGKAVNFKGDKDRKILPLYNFTLSHFPQEI
ncbi:PAAR domain-containing protein [Acerihabitans sp. KWT182]|uniref:PAAR domain-containing protein n=1 Tax=Acerihabitans sp. KWT182 TaxID=3157919 RepID=A0AAU7Q9A2_9GAMM